MATAPGTKKKKARIDTHNAYLVEVAWEVCQKVGGIYQVIRSKLPSTMSLWADHYVTLGPYFQAQVATEFEPASIQDDALGVALKKLKELGVEVHYGRWLVSGRPKVVLINPYGLYHRLAEIKYFMWENHHIPCDQHDELIDQVLAFSFGSFLFLKLYREALSAHALENTQPEPHLLAHFHEWMVAYPIAEIRRENLNIKTVFTTHATILGRYLAMNDDQFYHHLPFFNWEVEAQKFNINTQVRIERAAAHGCHVFTTVSDVTGFECEHLLGRCPDVILPNGLNIERFTALHEFQNLHQKYKARIHEFVMGHFFPSYSFDLDKTLYFFTSGRYEYKNKGFDMTLDALARLNWRLQKDKIDINIVMFFVTKKPFYTINPKVLQSRAILAELRDTCSEIQTQIGERLFYQATLSADQKVPPLNDFVDEHLRLRYRRTIQTWKNGQLPLVVTHTLVDSHDDEILTFLRGANLVNNSYDRVKVVYHPDFISYINPLFHMDYDNFVRGCHLGIFPSYYEPWGYTPLECMARGVPAMTSDLAGFGDYIQKEMPKALNDVVYVVERRHQSYHQAVDQMVDQLYDFVCQDQRQRIEQRNKVESYSVNFDWEHLRRFYDLAYLKALSLES